MRPSMPDLAHVEIAADNALLSPKYKRWALNLAARGPIVSVVFAVARDTSAKALAHGGNGFARRGCLQIGFQRSAIVRKIVLLGQPYEDFGHKAAWIAADETLWIGCRLGEKEKNNSSPAQ